MRKRHRHTCPWVFLVLLFGWPLAGQAQFVPGNLVVLRVGDGSATLSNASTLTFLDEYTPTGTLVSTVQLNATDATNKLTNTGNGTSEGMMTLSANGQYLLTTGYNAATGVASISSTTAASTARTVARIGSNRVPDITTALADAFSGGNIRGAASVDGSSFFLVGSVTGLRYSTAGAVASKTTSTTITSERVVHSYRGQLYFSTASGTAPGIYKVGSATNTAASQAATSFLATGSGTNSASPYGFVLLDRDPNVPGIDAAYVADDGGAAADGGIQKWSFDGTAWTLQGTVLTPARGLTGTLNPDGSATLYATGRTSLGGNSLLLINDTNPYNAAPSVATATAIATAAQNQALRGVDFAPGTVVALPVELTSLGASRSAAGVQVAWTTASELNSARFEVERSANGSLFERVAVVAAQGSTTQAHRYTTLDALAPATHLYYRLHQLDQDGTAAYSPIVAVAAAGTAPVVTLAPNPARERLTLTTAQAATYAVRTALGREVLRGTAPAGTTSLMVAELPAGLYFLLLNQGSGWVTQRFVKE